MIISTYLRRLDRTKYTHFISVVNLSDTGTMWVPEGDLHCQCKLSIFSLSSFGPCIVFWILQKGNCIGKCIFSIFPAVTHQLKYKQTCIEKCRPRHKISMKKWSKILQISKNINLFPYITTNLHCIVSPLLQTNNSFQWTNSIFQNSICRLE